MIPYGPFHPDAAGTNTKAVIQAANVLPGAAGFRPFPSLVSGTTALPATCFGAASVILDSGSVATFAGTATKLYKLDATEDWDEATRVSGGDYSTVVGDRWNFDAYGSSLIAVNGTDAPQVIDFVSGTNFAALGGSPPVARYVAVIREFAVLGGLYGNEKRVQWSSNGNITAWTSGTGESDFQDIPNGGPVRGLIGGEVGYVFQAGRVTRMNYEAGTALIFRFDEIEGGVGLSGPHSLVKLRNDAFYLAPDGLRKIALGSLQSTPIGVGKFANWFLADLKAGSETTVLGAAHPVKPLIVWAYASKQNPSTSPNRLLIYDWSLDEATYADLTVEALVRWLSPGVDLDSMNSYGTLDTLPFSLDSPFWRGGAGLFGIFGTDHTLSLQAGTPIAATIVTSDGKKQGRRLITGTIPAIDASGVTVEIAARENVTQSVSFNTAESMEDTGVVPAHASGNLFRARINIPATTWTLAQGIETIDVAQGGR